jgi:hypothetical protein
MDIPIESVKVGQLMNWLELKLTAKYEASLLALKISFFTLYNAFRQMVHLALDIYDHFSS